MIGSSGCGCLLGRVDADGDWVEWMRMVIGSSGCGCLLGRVDADVYWVEWMRMGSGRVDADDDWVEWMRMMIWSCDDNARYQLISTLRKYV